MFRLDIFFESFKLHFLTVVVMCFYFSFNKLCKYAQSKLSYCINSRGLIVLYHSYLLTLSLFNKQLYSHASWQQMPRIIGLLDSHFSLPFSLLLSSSFCPSNFVITCSLYLLFGLVYLFLSQWTQLPSIYFCLSSLCLWRLLLFDSGTEERFRGHFLSVATN